MSFCGTGSSTEVRTWVDEQTGRVVRQLTDMPEGAALSYFRFPRHLPGGWMLGWGKHETGHMLLVHPDTGEVRGLDVPAGGWGSRLREHDGLIWYVKHRREDADDRKSPAWQQLWSAQLPGGEPRLIAELPPDTPGYIIDVTCDGRKIILLETVQDYGAYPIPRVKEVEVFWRFFNRPRRGAIWVYDIETGACEKIHETFGVCPLHVDASPSDPTLIRFCLDMFDAYGQRIWTIRTDGSELRKIRPQAFGELVTHEFWWNDPSLIGYTYQDRRGDETLNTLPWAEYSPRPTRLGLANLDGEEVYLSDPLNSYHSHIFRSQDGHFVSGEGTDGHSCVYAARFSPDDTKVEMTPMATVRAGYVPFRGQNVEAGFSADSRWLLFNQQIGEHFQICAVEMDL